MELKSLFLKANNELENTGNRPRSRRITCKKCGKQVSVARIRKNNFVCPECGHYFPVRARRRILMRTDKRSFGEMDRDIESKNVVNVRG